MMFNNPMYYNNPYYFPNQGIRNVAKRGILFSLFGTSKINWSNFLNNTQKTLNVINQAIPVYYQIKPICQNAKTMFRMMNALKEDDVKLKKPDNTKKNTSNSGPIFFT